MSRRGLGGPEKGLQSVMFHRQLLLTQAPSVPLAVCERTESLIRTWLRVAPRLLVQSAPRAPAMVTFSARSIRTPEPRDHARADQSREAIGITLKSR